MCLTCVYICWVIDRCRNAVMRRDNNEKDVLWFNIYEIIRFLRPFFLTHTLYATLNVRWCSDVVCAVLCVCACVCACELCTCVRALCFGYLYQYADDCTACGPFAQASATASDWRVNLLCKSLSLRALHALYKYAGSIDFVFDYSRFSHPLYPIYVCGGVWFFSFHFAHMHIQRASAQYYNSSLFVCLVVSIEYWNLHHTDGWMKHLLINDDNTIYSLHDSSIYHTIPWYIYLSCPLQHTPDRADFYSATLFWADATLSLPLLGRPCTETTVCSIIMSYYYQTSSSRCGCCCCCFY